MRTVIVGGCRLGKSTLARSLGAPVFCMDPRSKAKDPEPSVTYLAEGLSFGSDSTQWALDNWLGMPGPWTIEGHSTARLLRKWMKFRDQAEEDRPGLVLNPFPCERVIVLTNEPWVELLPGQARLNETVGKQWAEISWYFEPITEER